MADKRVDADEWIARLEILLDDLRQQNEELKQRVESELDRLRIERRVRELHAEEEDEKAARFRKEVTGV
jgi:hypothetical protein